LVNSATTKVPLGLKEKFFCPNLASNLKKAYGGESSPKVYYCNIKKVFGIETLTFSYDSIYPGVKSIGYLFNTNEKMIRFFLSCKKEFCPEIQNETELIFKNMTFSSTNQVEEPAIDEAITFTKKVLLSDYCKKGSFFRECFDISQQSCTTIAKNNIKQCARQHRDSFADPVKFKHTGEIIGQCSGANMVLLLKNKFKDSDVCRKWGGSSL